MAVEEKNGVIATLTILHADGKEQLVTLKSGDSIRLGRDESNEVVIADSSVSRQHAIVDCSSLGVVVTDLSSRNGTFVNGAPLLSAKDLKPGDVLNVGNAKVAISFRSKATSAPATRPKGARAMTTKLKQVSVTVLVASVRRYRTLLSSFPSEEVEEAFSDWHMNVGAIVSRHGGAVERADTGALIAIWCAEQAANQAQLAARAAQELVEAAESFSHTPPHLGGSVIPFECSIVLSSGLGLAEERSGVTTPQDFSIVGEPVTLAFAMQGETDEFSVPLVMDAATEGFIKKSFRTRFLGQSPRVEPGVEIPLFTFAD